MTTPVDHYVTLQRGRALPGRGIAWLDTLRARGVQEFISTGFPTLQDEDWRHTNLRPMQKHQFAPTARADEAAGQDLSWCAIEGLDASRVVFVDGRFAAALTDLSGLPAGVTAEPLAVALQSGRAEIGALLGTCVPEDRNGFVSLNSSFVEDGLYLHVADGCTVDRPLEIVYFTTGAEGQLVQPRNLFVVGQRSSVKIIERYVSASASSYFTNAVTELVVSESAMVEHTKLQEEGSKAFHIGGVYLRLLAGARAVSNNVALGSLLARTDVKAVLSAPGAACDLNGLYLANGRQHIDNFTQVDHQQPDCTSDEFYKGVLGDRARAVFRGRVIVHRDAQHTDAQQQNRNLLMSADAEIDTKPQLEIYADDVKCSHGATVGQLDETALYYLRSRGLDANTARSLLTYAFAADVVGRFAQQPIREYIEGALSRKLFKVDGLEELV